MSKNFASSCTVFFAGNVEHDGFSHYVIFGKHINGGFVAIPSLGISAEQSLHNDRGYNVNKLTGAGMEEKTAEAIADFCADWIRENKPETKVDLSACFER